MPQDAPDNRLMISQEKKKGLFKQIQWTRRTSLVAAALALIVIAGAFLRFYKLGAYGVGNTYYAAGVKSMLTSWRNFFFVAFEPGGSVSIDKPPLGFWLQALSASIFGFNGFALAFPQALAGTLSIPLLFVIVKKQFSDWAGLISAAVLAFMPVAVSTERNNTIDGLLVFFLLLAVWAVLKSVQTGKFRFLLLGAVLVGLGFNIKMLQAFMPLPGIYLLYLIGSKQSWWKRIWHLAVASVVLLVVSFSWAVVVDLVPAADRPYVGSSTNNSELELIFGWNGVSRILGMFGRSPNALSGQASNPDGQMPSGQPPEISGDFQPRQGGNGQFEGGLPPNGQLPPSARNDGRPGGSGGPFNNAQPGLNRLFIMPLADQASWLLPAALLGILLVIALVIRKWAAREQLMGVLLWGGWLLPMLAYFSFTTGLFHSYYLIMLGPGIAALVGIAAWGISRIFNQRKWIGLGLAAFLIAVTVLYQVVLLKNFPAYSKWLIPASLALVAADLALLVWSFRKWLNITAVSLICVGVLLAPFTWSLETATSRSNAMLPNAGPSEEQFAGPMSNLQGEVNQTLLQYLLANTKPGSYLVAVNSAMEASPFVLATDRAVLTFGGFTGSDNVVDVEELAALVSSGQLRFVIVENQLNGNKQEILAWVKSNCTPVSLNSGVSLQGVGPLQFNNLYDCGIH